MPSNVTAQEGQIITYVVFHLGLHNLNLAMKKYQRNLKCRTFIKTKNTAFGTVIKEKYVLKD